MAISKGWKWEILSKDDEYWNTPDFMMHYLKYRWSSLGFNTFLDLGCGLGRHSLFMAENGFSVYAFDNSKYVVDIVKEKAYDKNLDIKLCVGNISDIPYENESIDCMVAIGILSNNDIEGISRILDEMHRVLKTGGETYFNIISQVSDIGVDDELLNGNNFYNITESDFEYLFKNFEVIDIKHIDELTDNFMSMPSYCVLLKKVDKNGTFKDNKIGDSAYLV